MAGRKTLATMLFAALFAMSLVVMFAATIASVAASFSSYEARAEQLLLSRASSYAALVAPLGDEDGMRARLEGIPFVGMRCTLIAADGSVVFDSDVDPSTMGNHAGRAEILAARESGQGTIMRRSETLGTDMLYAAIEVRDGIVLRLAETRISHASFLGGMAPQLAVSLVAIFILSLLSSRALTAMVARPLREVDLTSPLGNDAYAELQPLLKRVDDQRRELERAVMMRREFTGNVSHEMKTPLQVIGGYAELMENGMIDAKDVPRFAGLIRGESESMRLLIDDVLTLSRLDENACSETGTVFLADTCRRAIRRLEPTARERGIVFALDADEHAAIAGEPSLADQMVYNLIDNAVKYNREGGTVSVGVSRSGGDVVLTVSDEGSGIARDQRERIFERFYRIDTSRSRETGGTGLGLAIVKHAAESFGGTVSVGDSTSGATFVVTIPCAPIPER